MSSERLERAKALCRHAIDGLCQLQNEDGSYNLGSAENPAPIAVTALATLALLSTGEMPGRTRHGIEVERGIRFLVDRQDRSNSPTRGYIRAENDRVSKMHGQGYATLALAQVLGMLPSGDSAIVTQREAHDALAAATKLIQACQEPTTGGWYYDPVARGHEGSITVCLVQALRAAKGAGMAVDLAVIRRAVRYVERSQKPDGSFRYRLNDGQSSTALTAAAVMTLNASGAYGNPVLLKGLAYLTDQAGVLRLGRGHSPRSSKYPFYERLYVGEALFTARDQDAFRRWYPRTLKRLAAEQSDNGAWKSARYGAAYATAMNVLVLSLPFQYLPIRQR